MSVGTDWTANAQRVDGQALKRSVALSDDEIKQLSEKPIQDSLRDYRKVKWAVGGVYLLLIGILLKVGIDHVPAEWWDWISQAYHSVLRFIDRGIFWINRQIP